MKKTISGIRGIVGNDFSLNDVLQFCNNFSILVKSKKCVIARDTRPTGDMISESVKSILMQNGVDVFDLGVSPTPVAFRESRKYGAGVIVTSSHNPIEWNGLKFIIDGRGINEREIEFVINKQNIPASTFGNEFTIQSSYVEEALGIIGKLKNSPKVSIDIGGGAAKTIAPQLLNRIGCKTAVINEDIENTSRGPDPTSDSLSELISMTNDGIGFAFDLDGDRLVVVINGRKMTPDVTLGLGVAKALELGYKKFVFSIDTSVSVEKYVLERGGIVQRSKVGEANVIDLMIKSKAQAGGEGSSGGFILPEFNFCRDGILTSGLISSMISTSEFDEILSFMEKYHQIRDKVTIPSEIHDVVITSLVEKIRNDYSEIITLDGVKAIVDEDSWVLIRKSNTEDIIRVSSESNDFEKAKRIHENIIKLVKECHEQIR